MTWQTVADWFFALATQYGVDPLIFGGLYVGAIPFFMFSAGWTVRNMRRNKSILWPGLAALVSFTAAYLYLFVAGDNLPFWMYACVIGVVSCGGVTAFRRIRDRAADRA